MPNKMLPARLFNACLLLGLFSATSAFAAGELNTLFTTPQERQLINANRYKSDEVKLQQVVTGPDDESPIQLLAQREVSVDYRISGISLAADGAHIVWINGIAYDDGARLDDGSRVKIYAGQDIRARITTPDGRHYYATSGETLRVTYMAAVEN
jgi:hypothetical protein